MAKNIQNLSFKSIQSQQIPDNHGDQHITKQSDDSVRGSCDQQVPIVIEGGAVNGDRCRFERELELKNIKEKTTTTVTPTDCLKSVTPSSFLMDEEMTAT